MNLKPKFHYFLIILTMFVGIVLSISAFIASRNWDYQEIQGYFKDKAEHRYALMKMEMELNLQAGQSLKALYVSNQEVTRAQFRDFAQELLLQHPSIQALEWIPRIPDVQRPLYEQEAKREGFPLFHITERDAHGNLIRAARRNEYFPVYFVEPFKGNEVAFGFDLASHPTRKMALESARDTGNTVTSQRVKLVQETAVQYGFLVFVPVYRRGLPSNTLETRREHLQGFVLVVFRAGDIVEKSLAGIQPAGINYVLYNMSAPEGERHLYSHQSRLRPKNITQEIENNPVSNPLYQDATTLNVAGREWMILFTATPDFLASRISWQPWGILFIGLLLTGLVAGHFLSNLRNMRSLSAMNAQLFDEIEERKRTEGALQDSETKLQAIFDTVGAGIIIIDRETQIIIEANQMALEMTGLTKEKMIGQICHSLVCPAQAGKCPVKDLGQSVDNSERKLLCADGHLKDILKTVYPITIKGRDFYLESFIDISEINLMNEALKKREAQLNEMGRIAKVGGWEFDVETQKQVWTKEVYRIHEVDESYKPTVDKGIEFYAPESRPVIERAVQRAIDYGEPFDVELEIITAKGNHRWVHANGHVHREDGMTKTVSGIFQDITNRKRAEEALHRSEMKFRTLYDSTSDAVMLLDEKGFFDCNKATLAIFGCATLEEFCLKHPYDLSPPKQPCGTDSMVLANQMIATAMEKGSIHFEWMHKRNDTGKTFPADVLLNAMELDGKRVVQAVVRDITELKRSKEKMEFFAAHDVLTGLLNRRSLEEILNRSTARAKRGTFSSLLYMDLDNFKDVNDTVGHAVGDEVLITIAGLLKAELRTEDVVVRLGGDEFAVLLDGIDGGDAISAAERVLSAVETHPFEQEGRVFPLSLSIGLIAIDGTLATAELMSQADVAMYRAKAQGRNRMVVAQSIPTAVNKADVGVRADTIDVVGKEMR
jgi:diguanylate cyclase (GGDEF)-like protein/PAS domain S-box-containing protein